MYFSYHTLQGERGLTRAWGLSQETKQLEQEYAALKSERETLEARVQMLRPSSLHKDLLEERVRVVLGYGHADEILLMRN